MALLGLAGAAVPALADRKDHLQDKREHLSDKVHEARRDLDASSKMLYRATSALEGARARLSEARGELARVLGQLEAARALDDLMQRRLAAAERRLADAEADLDNATQVVDEQQADIEDFALRSYATSDPSLIGLNLVLSGQSPTDLSSTISAAESVVESQTADLDHLDASRIMLSLREQRVEELRDDVAAQRAEAAANLDRMRDLTDQARHQTQVVHGLVDEQRAARDRAHRAKEHDLRLLQHMERERDRVHDQLQALARRQARRSSTTTTTTTSSGDGGGFLNYPIDGGYITSPYGMRLHPILHVWKLHDGTDFGAACGTPVHAAASGTIVSRVLRLGLRQPGDHEPRHRQRDQPVHVVQPPHQLRRRHRSARRTRAADRLLGHHRLLDRLPLALHGLRQRCHRRSDGLALAEPASRNRLEAYATLVS